MSEHRQPHMIVLATGEETRSLARVLRADDPEDGLRALARAVAADPMWQSMPEAALVIRTQPRAVLAVLGRFDLAEEARLRFLQHQLREVLPRLRPVSYARAERDCERLASMLLETLGEDELRRCRFAPIPRGGLIVLGMLAYLLDLKPEQLEGPHPSGIPLVVVDDCALTGTRFRRFLQGCGDRPVLFAHLYSHPDLRSAIEAGEPRVQRCLAAQDLHDYAPEGLGDAYPAWREERLARVERPYGWVGQLDHLCFPWSEPDVGVWNPETEQVERGWHLVPPEHCLKNRPAPGTEPIPVQVQPEGRGPLRPAPDVLFGCFEGQMIVGSTETGVCFGLRDAAADMWRALVEYGSLDKASAVLVDTYEADGDAVQGDIAAFASDLRRHGLLVEDDAVSLDG